MNRVSKRNPCPICGRPDWCLIADDGSACICQRVSEGSVKRCDEAGFLHILRNDDDRRTRPQVRTVRLDLSTESMFNIGGLAAEWAAVVNMTDLEAFADSLGVSATSLVRLRIGWAEPHRAWCFPMHSPDGRQVLGICLRSPTGRKWSVRGGKEGLFLPTGMDYSGPLLITEGPTDTAAGLDLGFEVVGRPSCAGGARLLVELVKMRRPVAVVVVSDNDDNGAGQRGAENLASILLPYVVSLKDIRPPDGIKDLRAWKQSGATHSDIQAVIDAAPVRSLRIDTRCN